MKDINIRKCTEEDIDDIIALQEIWESEDITYGFKAADKEYLENKLGDYFFIAEKESVIVGFVYGTIHKAKDMSVLNDGECYIEIDDIYTISQCRGKGVGSALLDKIVDVAKDNGVERSLLYSSTKDIDSIINFYEKHDYKSWYIQMFK